MVPSVAFAADWVYADGYIDDGVWKLPASGTSGLTLNRVDGSSAPDKRIPASVTALDLSKRITNADGDKEYYISNISTRGLTNVGELTLPGEGLTVIGYSAFGSCSSLCGDIVFPSTLTDIGQAFPNGSAAVFSGPSFASVTTIGNRALQNAKIDGVLDLSSLTKIEAGALSGANMTAIRFGGHAVELDSSGYGGGSFENCKSLAAVECADGCEITMNGSAQYGTKIFKGCTALTSLDMRALKSVTLLSDEAPFNGCSSLAQIALSGKLQSMPSNLFCNVGAAFNAIHFYGAPPAEIVPPVLYNVDVAQGVICYVHLDKSDADYATQKAAWDALTAGGTLTKSSTWSEAMAGADYASRPLQLFETASVSVAKTSDADESTATSGIFTFSRGAEDSTDSALVVNYTVTGTATAGVTYTALPGSVTIPAGERSATVEVAPLYDYTTKESTVIVTVSENDLYEITTASATMTIFDCGSQTVTITASGDADEGKGVNGYVTVSRGENECTTYPLAVAYTVGGSAASGTTYAALSGTVTIPAGKKTSEKILITPLDDAATTEDKTVEITLSASTDYDLGDEVEAEVAVVNGAVYGGWKYVETKTEWWTSSGYITNAVSGWAFTAKHGLHYAADVNAQMTVTTPLAWPATPGTVDMSLAITDGTDGYRVISFSPNFSSYAAAQSQVRGFVPSEFQTAAGGFLGCANLSGTIVFNNDEMSLGAEAFQNCSSLEAVVFNCKTVSIGGNYNRGAFQGCSALRSVTFAPDCETAVKDGFCFKDCSALKTIDLSTVTTISCLGDSWTTPLGASGLRHLILGDKATSILGKAFNNSNLKEIVFKGTDPDALEATVLSGAPAGLVCYVELDPSAADYATLLAKWKACSATGELDASTTTWSEAKVGSGYASYPLLLKTARTIAVEKIRDADEASARTGLFRLSRGENDVTNIALHVEYSVGGTAIADQTYVALTGMAEIPAGETYVDVYVFPKDDPATASDTTVTITLLPFEADVSGSGTASVTIANGAGWRGWDFTWTSYNYQGYHGSITNRNTGWSFAALANFDKGTVEVNAVEAWPDAVSPLDFSAGIISTNGVALSIAALCPAFYNNSAAGAVVGELTLPTDVTTAIGTGAFKNCTNATGVIVFPSTLTSINYGGSNAECTFYNCTGLTFSCSAPWPQGLTAIPSSCFYKGHFDGELVLEPVKTVGYLAFQDSDLGSVRFGKALTTLTSTYQKGTFQDCHSLTNVVFDPESRVEWGYGDTFHNCDALEELDLSGVVTITVTDDESNPNNTSRPPFIGCTNLKKVTFGATLENLPKTVFAGTTVSEVRFKGLPPVNMKTPYLYRMSASQTVKTVVPKALVNVENANGVSWASLAAGGVIDRYYSRRANTTFAAEYLQESITDLQKRLLVTDQTPPGLRISIR